MKKHLKWIIPLALVLVIGTVGAWLMTSKLLFAHGQLVSRGAQALDFRGEELSFQDYEELKQTLPGCYITWDVPFQGGTYASDSTQLRVDSLNEEDLALLEHFTALRTLDATNCTDYDTLLDYQARHPGCQVLYRVSIGAQQYAQDSQALELADVSLADIREALKLLPQVNRIHLTGSLPSARELLSFRQEYPGILLSWDVTFRGQTYPSGTLELDLTGNALTYEEADSLLAFLPLLEKCDMTGCGLTDEEMMRLADTYYQTFFVWELEILGQSFSTDSVEIDISGKKIADVSQVEVFLPYLPCLERLIMSDCGPDDETMDAFNRRHENVQIIWTVYIKGYPVRTDTWHFYPYKIDPNRFPWHDAMTDTDVYPLRYCTEIRSIDIGHNTSISSIDWVAFMPELRYLIIGDTPVSDISPLVNCKKLVFLEAGACPFLRDISPLVECTGLRDLNLGKLYRVDPTPVTKMTWLNRLWWSNADDLAYESSVAPTIVPPALPDTICNFTVWHPAGDGWRTFQHYYEMRDIMGMFYLR